MRTTLSPQGSPDTLYVVDLSGYVFRAYHGMTPLSAPSGEPTHATLGTITMLRRLLDEHSPKLVAVAMDSRVPSFRKQIDPSYKANRPPPPADLGVQMRRCAEIAGAMGLAVWQRDGFEADDVIATSAHWAVAQGLKVVIVSSDKDLMQLVTEQVSVWDPIKNKAYGPEEVAEKFGVPPGALRDLLALTGDSSDNVRGVPGIGPKSASELLREFGSIECIFERIDEVSKPRWRQLLQDHHEQLQRAQTLVTLKTDVQLGLDMATLRHQRADTERLRNLYSELGFRRLLDSMAHVSVSSSQTADFTLVTTRADLSELAVQCAGSPIIGLRVVPSGAGSIQADIVGIAIATAAGRAAYIPIGHRYLGAGPQLLIADVRDTLAMLLSSDRPGKAVHDLKTTELLLTQHGFGSLRGVCIDSMLASYLLDPDANHELEAIAQLELGETIPAINKLASKKQDINSTTIEQMLQGAASEANAIFRLAERLQQKLAESGLQDLLNDVELPLSLVLARMERWGVRLDLARFSELSKQLERRLVELEAQAKQQAGRDFNVNSPRQLETILFDELKLTSVKKTKTGRSTDAEVLEALSDKHPVAATVLEHRQLAKLKGTYVDALPKLVNPATGRVHTSFNQCVTATGRLSSSDPNLQNIPVRSDIGRLIRGAFVAEPGFVLVSADYSQIELRLLAHMANDPVLIDAFCNGQDVHARTAMEIFGVAASDVTKPMRAQAKTINFGVIYGMGEVALSKQLGISRAQASEFIETYFSRYSAVRSFLQQVCDTARRDGAVRTILGRKRLFRDLDSTNKQLSAQAERMAANTPIQGSAADILKLAMCSLNEPVVEGARMLLTVHDELVFEVPEDRVAEAVAIIRSKMENAYPLRVPLTVDVGTGANWAEAH